VSVAAEAEEETMNLSRPHRKTQMTEQPCPDCFAPVIIVRANSSIWCPKCKEIHFKAKEKERQRCKWARRLEVKESSMEIEQKLMIIDAMKEKRKKRWKH